MKMKKMIIIALFSTSLLAGEAVFLLMRKNQKEILVKQQGVFYQMNRMYQLTQ